MRDLNLVRQLVHILDAGSMSEAARRQGVTRSHVSKELKRLEEMIGASLVRRTTRKLVPTEQGRTLYEHGVRMLAELLTAQASIDRMGTGVRGHIRISMPTALGEFFLTRHLFAFQHLHPGVTVNVVLSNRIFDLVSAQVDVAIRVTSDPPLDVVARELRDIRWGLYASAALFDTMAGLSSPEQLDRFPFACTSTPQNSFLLRLYKGRLRREVRLRPRVQSENIPLLHQAMLSGLGVALLPEYTTSRDLADGRARVVLPEWIPEGLGGKLYIMTIYDRQPSHATQALIAYLRDALAGSW